MGRLYRLFIWVQYMQGSTTTPLTASYPESRTGSPQSIAKILRFLRLSAKTKIGVQRSWGWCAGCLYGDDTCKGQLQHRWLQNIHIVGPNHLNLLQRSFVSFVCRLRRKRLLTANLEDVQAVRVGPIHARGNHNTIDCKSFTK